MRPLSPAGTLRSDPQKPVAPSSSPGPSGARHLSAEIPESAQQNPCDFVELQSGAARAVRRHRVGRCAPVRGTCRTRRRRRVLLPGRVRRERRRPLPDASRALEAVERGRRAEHAGAHAEDSAAPRQSRPRRRCRDTQPSRSLQVPEAGPGPSDALQGADA